MRKTPDTLQQAVQAALARCGAPSTRHPPRAKLTPSCKQLLDPILALEAFLLLKQLRASTTSAARFYVFGMREVSQLLQHGTRPLAVLVAFDIDVPHTQRVARSATLAVDLAWRAGIPVAFALSRQDMGAALALAGGVTCLAVMDVGSSGDLFRRVMERATQLCCDYCALPEHEARRTNAVMGPLIGGVTF